MSCDNQLSLALLSSPPLSVGGLGWRARRTSTRIIRFVTLISINNNASGSRQPHGRAAAAVWPLAVPGVRCVAATRVASQLGAAATQLMATAPRDGHLSRSGRVAPRRRRRGTERRGGECVGGFGHAVSCVGLSHIVTHRFLSPVATPPPAHTEHLIIERAAIGRPRDRPPRVE